MSARHVHNLRKEARRLQVRLELSNAVLGDRPCLKLIRTVTGQLHSMGPLRDSQVQLKLLRKMERGVPRLHSLRAHLKRRRRLLCIATGKLIEKRHIDRQIVSLERELAASPDHRSSDGRNRHLICNAVLSSRKIADAALSKARTGTRALHRARIALKHYSLISDVLPSLRTGAVARERRELLRRVALLGNVHDLDVLLKRIANTARRHFKSKKSRKGLHDSLVNRRAAAFDLLFSAQRTRTAAPSNRPALRSASA
jgi:CHAD domain-containing protein